MDKLEEILEASYHIRANYKINQHIYNDGNNDTELVESKKKFIKDVFEKLDTLVGDEKHYPVDGIQEIDLTLDLIIIQRADLDKILKKDAYV